MKDRRNSGGVARPLSPLRQIQQFNGGGSPSSSSVSHSASCWESLMDIVVLSIRNLKDWRRKRRKTEKKVKAKEWDECTRKTTGERRAEAEASLLLKDIRAFVEKRMAQSGGRPVEASIIQSSDWTKVVFLACLVSAEEGLEALTLMLRGWDRDPEEAERNRVRVKVNPLDRLPDDPVKARLLMAFNSVILELSLDFRADLALSVWKQLKEEGLEPQERSYGFLLNAFRRSYSDTAFEVWRELLHDRRVSSKSRELSYNTVLAMLVICAFLRRGKDALEVLKVDNSAPRHLLQGTQGAELFLLVLEALRRPPADRARAVRWHHLCTGIVQVLLPFPRQSESPKGVAERLWVVLDRQTNTHALFEAENDEEAQELARLCRHPPAPVTASPDVRTLWSDAALADADEEFDALMQQGGGLPSLEIDFLDGLFPSPSTMEDESSAEKGAAAAEDQTDSLWSAVTAASHSRVERSDEEGEEGRSVPEGPSDYWQARAGLALWQAREDLGVHDNPKVLTSLMALLREFCRSEEVLPMFRQAFERWKETGMDSERCPLDTSAFNEALLAACRLHLADEALRILTLMDELGVPPDHLTFAILVLLHSSAWGRGAAGAADLVLNRLPEYLRERRRAGLPPWGQRMPLQHAKKALKNLLRYMLGGLVRTDSEIGTAVGVVLGNAPPHVAHVLQDVPAGASRLPQICRVGSVRADRSDDDLFSGSFEFKLEEGEAENRGGYCLGDVAPVYPLDPEICEGVGDRHSLSLVDGESLTMLIEGFCRVGNLPLAFEVFRRMCLFEEMGMREFAPDGKTLCALLKGLSRFDVRTAECLDGLGEEGGFPYAVRFIQATVNEAKKRGIWKGAVRAACTGAALEIVCSQMGCPDVALRLLTELESMKEPLSVRQYAGTMRVLVACGRGREAELIVYRMMEHHRESPRGWKTHVPITQEILDALGEGHRSAAWFALASDLLLRPGHGDGGGPSNALFVNNGADRAQGWRQFMFTPSGRSIAHEMRMFVTVMEDAWTHGGGGAAMEIFEMLIFRLRGALCLRPDARPLRCADVLQLTSLAARTDFRILPLDGGTRGKRAEAACLIGRCFLRVPEERWTFAAVVSTIVLLLRAGGALTGRAKLALEIFRRASARGILMHPRIESLNVLQTEPTRKNIGGETRGARKLDIHSSAAGEIITAPHWLPGHEKRGGRRRAVVSRGRGGFACVHVSAGMHIPSYSRGLTESSHPRRVTGGQVERVAFLWSLQRIGREMREGGGDTGEESVQLPECVVVKSEEASKTIEEMLAGFSPPVRALSLPVEVEVEVEEEVDAEEAEDWVRGDQSAVEVQEGAEGRIADFLPRGREKADPFPSSFVTDEAERGGHLERKERQRQSPTRRAGEAGGSLSLSIVPAGDDVGERSSQTSPQRERRKTDTRFLAPDGVLWGGGEDPKGGWVRLAAGSDSLRSPSKDSRSAGQKGSFTFPSPSAENSFARGRVREETSGGSDGESGRRWASRFAIFLDTVALKEWMSEGMRVHFDPNRSPASLCEQQDKKSSRVGKSKQTEGKGRKSVLAPHGREKTARQEKPLPSPGCSSSPPTQKQTSLGVLCSDDDGESLDSPLPFPLPAEKGFRLNRKSPSSSHERKGKLLSRSPTKNKSDRAQSSQSRACSTTKKQTKIAQRQPPTPPDPLVHDPSPPIPLSSHLSPVQREEKREPAPPRHAAARKQPPPAERRRPSRSLPMHDAATALEEIDRRSPQPSPLAPLPLSLHEGTNSRPFYSQLDSAKDVPN
uniref:Pentacotripeptide-repeat region of PRORP domain-containing protein n=1 Tax=Chromera velia CCMP2878 TaxID=1169474 RepID=A0A0G4GP15_9ALVE|eukprot:Cvel_4994.t1-p1 / transcript=Cvel_4994.t1 / gene=Cvel_4994 / organism=Chromera_velia_CCMP2878 / gene_product=hypothetical protein / transcript_product=hypothetical protein / location=Cvel_scaffold226:35980-43912(+) / protein_length=1766 / sequence_SO=supercontig / SO=protein_coding / is_pseudo=false